MQETWTHTYSKASTARARAVSLYIRTASFPGCLPSARCTRQVSVVAWVSASRRVRYGRLHCICKFPIYLKLHSRNKEPAKLVLLEILLYHRSSFSSVVFHKIAHVQYPVMSKLVLPITQTTYMAATTGLSDHALMATTTVTYVLMDGHCTYTWWC